MPTALRQQKYPFGSLRKDPHWSVQGLVYYSQFKPAGKLIDESLYGNHGTITGATWVGNGLSFSGSPDYVNLNTDVLNAPTVFTYLAIITPSGSGSRTIVGGNINYPQWRVSSGGVQQLLKASVTSMGTSSTVIPTSGPQHVACSYDGSTVRFYLNGVADGAPSSTQTFLTQTTFVGAKSASAEWFDGLIFDVKVYNRVLSVSEIQQLFIKPDLLMQQEPIWLLSSSAVGVTMVAHYYRHLMQGIV